jgi:uncharacterized protein (DUF849 family)
MIVGKQIICVAPNGARRGKADHPALPVSPEELALCAQDCLAAGASAIHVHVRDDLGRHVLDADRYIVATQAIRAAVGCSLIVQITTEALGVYSPHEQMQLIRDVEPEAVSIALREILPDPTDAAARSQLSQFMAKLCRTGTIPQIILYTPEEIDLLADLVGDGVFPWPTAMLPVLFVLGRYTTDRSCKPSDILPFLAPSRCVFASWSLCAFGRNEAACTTIGLSLGGSARVGFENNLELPDGTIAVDNARLVKNLAQAARLVGVPLATAEELRGEWRRKVAEVGHV